MHDVIKPCINKRTWKDGPVDFNVTEYEKFIVTVSTLRKLTVLEFLVYY